MFGSGIWILVIGLSDNRKARYWICLHSATSMQIYWTFFRRLEVSRSTHGILSRLFLLAADWHLNLFD